MELAQRPRALGLTARSQLQPDASVQDTLARQAPVRLGHLGPLGRYAVEALALDVHVVRGRLDLAVEQLDAATVSAAMRS